MERLPALIADLIQRKVNVIAATSTPAAFAAKAAATTIPIVFTMGGDPVRSGLVSSLSKPGGNLTGATTLNQEVVPKRLELMHQVLPTAINIALLVNPLDPLAEEVSRDMSAPAAALGLKLHVVRASSEQDLAAVLRILDATESQASRDWHCCILQQSRQRTWRVVAPPPSAGDLPTSTIRCSRRSDELQR